MIQILIRKSTSLCLFVIFKIASVYASPGADSINTLLLNYQYKEVIDIIDEKLLQKPNEINFYLYKGSALKGLLKYDEAFKVYAIVLKTDSINHTALIESANICKLLGEYKKALAYLNKIDQIKPINNVKIEIANILLSYNNEDFTRAKNIYLNVYKSDSLNTFLIKNIAKCYESLKQTDSSIYYYEKAIKIKPSDYQSFVRLTNIYIDTKKYEKALETTEKYKTNNEYNQRINSLNAFLYLLESKYQEAIFNFKLCIKNSDTSEFVYKNMGIAYYNTEAFDTAKIFLEKAFSKDTTDAVTLEYLGISCSSTYNTKLGISYLERALRLKSPFAKSLSSLHKNLAESYNKIYNYSEALNSFLIAYDLNPKDTLLIYKIGSHYDNWIKNPDLALTYYEKFIATCPPRNTTDAPKNPFVLSYYDIAEKRINEIKSKSYKSTNSIKPSKKN